MNKEKDRFKGEMVLVVADEIIRKFLGKGHDFFPSPSGSIPLEIANHAKYIERIQAERDESYRQLIPYVIIRRMAEDRPEFFLLKRLSTQGEERLHNLYSLGVGGHINPIDDETGNPLMSGLYRELREELFLPDTIEMVFKGWIYSVIDPVSRVHAGMVFLLDPRDENINTRESDKMTSEWCDVEKLKERYYGMEGWSRIVMDHLIDKFLL